VPLRMPWGKHKGKVLSEVPAPYLCWMLEECSLSEPVRWAVLMELARWFEAKGWSTTVPSPSPARRNGDDAHAALMSAYRTLCLKYHPDRGGSTEAMRVLNEMLSTVRRALAVG
jgi:uncharacterized protein (DUF3820 family)